MAGMHDIFKTLGEAKAEAQQRAKRDGCAWHVFTRNSNVYPWQVVNEFENKNILLDHEKKIASYGPDTIPLILTREEAELVEYILREDVQTISPKADNPETRHSTWKKVKKYLAKL